MDYYRQVNLFSRKFGLVPSLIRIISQMLHDTLKNTTLCCNFHKYYPHSALFFFPLFIIYFNTFRVCDKHIFLYLFGLIFYVTTPFFCRVCTNLMFIGERENVGVASLGIRLSGMNLVLQGIIWNIIRYIIK